MSRRVIGNACYAGLDHANGRILKKSDLQARYPQQSGTAVMHGWHEVTRLKPIPRAGGSSIRRLLYRSAALSASVAHDRLVGCFL